MDNHEARQNREEEQQHSRRTFIKKIGTVVFSAEIVGLSACDALGQSDCGAGTTDATCGPIVSDSNCGGYYQIGYRGRMIYDSDESCGSSGGVTEEACSGQTTDESFEKLLPGGLLHTDDRA
jgi:hypothetical protein